MSIRSKFIKIEERENHYNIRCLFFKKQISKMDMRILNKECYLSSYKCKQYGCLNKLSFNSSNASPLIVSVDGFYDSGSSAFVDLLREFNNVDSFGIVEKYSGYTSMPYRNDFLSLYGELSFYKFEEYIGNNDVYSEDFLIKRIIKVVHANRNKFQSNFNVDLIDLFNTYILPMLNTKFISFEEIVNSFFKVIESDNVEDIVFLSLKDNVDIAKFRFNCSNFLRLIFSKVSLRDICCCDQLLTAYDGDIFDLHYRYLGSNFKQIVVYRDPRDQYVSLWKYYNQLLYTIDFLEKQLFPKYNFIQNYILERYPMKLKSYFDNVHSNKIIVRFEDLINDYDITIEKICSFLNIDRSNHINKGKYFIPEISKKNIGLYKKYYDQDFIKAISQQLGEYCYLN